jgi:hypothetical protein
MSGHVNQYEIAYLVNLISHLLLTPFYYKEWLPIFTWRWRQSAGRP